MGDDSFMKLHSEDRRIFPDCPVQVPMSILSEDWAMCVHSQSLKRLNERGGLGAREILINMDRLNPREGFEKWTDAEAVKELNKRLADIKTL